MFKTRRFILHPTITLKKQQQNKELECNVINVKNKNHLTRNIGRIISM